MEDHATDRVRRRLIIVTVPIRSNAYATNPARERGVVVRLRERELNCPEKASRKLGHVSKPTT